MSSLGIEVLEAVPKPDVVVVCCGGGGLLAGVAAAIKLSGCDKTKIYGVEPEGGKCSTATSPLLAGEAKAVTRLTVKDKDWACCKFLLLFKTQHVQCTKVSLRRSLWAWTQRASPQD